ncbi:hypothetical protein DFP72DRAFT_1174636 [Ephemerocybe angulata]|uniref:Uncharacterized protein n=1 Tax=Ephemerocybe angulata TaxID=980116 RepID=A0A8H6HKA6_9AGAR|nr:hypothetical protein DFP72DRAFT_1174636 [Tulosesus angulatus]
MFNFNPSSSTAPRREQVGNWEGADAGISMVQAAGRAPDVLVTPDVSSNVLRSLDGFQDKFGSIDKAREHFSATIGPTTVNVPSKYAPSTQYHYAFVLRAWILLLSILPSPPIKLENIWNEKVIFDWFKSLPMWFVANAKVGSTDRKLRARTLDTYCRIFLILVKNNGCSFENGIWVRAGGAILTQLNVYGHMLDTVCHVIFTQGLERGLREKAYYGRLELMLIMQYVYKMAKSGPKMIVSLMNIIRLLFTFFGTYRPSSLGWVSDKGRAAGLYPKIGDLKIFKDGWGIFRVIFYCRNYKGSLDAARAKEKSMTFDPVQLPHNIMNDVSLWIVTALWKRNMFVKKYKNTIELFSDPDLIMQLREDCLHLPLFPAAKTGGRGLLEGVPAGAKAASDFVAMACHAVGLARAGTTSFRRETGNKYGYTVSKEMAKTVMSHSDMASKSLDEYYSKGANNYNLTQLRLGEVEGDVDGKSFQEMFMKDLDIGRTALLSTFIDVVVLAEKKEAGDEELLSKDAEARESIRKAQDESTHEMAVLVEAKFRELMACIHPLKKKNGSSHTLKPVLRNATSVISKLRGTKAQDGGYTVKLLSPHTLANAEAIYAEMKKICENKTALGRQVGKRGKREQEKAKDRELENRQRQPEGSTIKRKAVLNRVTSTVDPLVVQSATAEGAQAALQQLRDAANEDEAVAESIAHDGVRIPMSFLNDDSDAPPPPPATTPSVSTIQELLDNANAFEQAINVDAREDRELNDDMDEIDRDMHDELQALHFHTEPGQKERRNHLITRTIEDGYLEDQRIEHEDERELDEVQKPEDGEANPFKGIDVRLVKFLAVTRIASIFEREVDLEDLMTAWTDEEKEARGLDPKVGHYSCSICLARSGEELVESTPIRRTKWERHMAEKHDDWAEFLESRLNVETRLYKCPGCIASFDSCGGLSLHISSSSVKCSARTEYGHLLEAHRKKSLATRGVRKAPATKKETSQAELRAALKKEAVSVAMATARKPSSCLELVGKMAELQLSENAEETMESVADGPSYEEIRSAWGEDNIDQLADAIGKLGSVLM